MVLRGHTIKHTLIGRVSQILVVLQMGISVDLLDQARECILGLENLAEVLGRFTDMTPESQNGAQILLETAKIGFPSWVIGIEWSEIPGELFRQLIPSGDRFF